jgi:transposase
MNVEKESLELLLGRGLSVDRIGKLFGKHPSTVSYWMKRYGLAANQRAKHSSKGGIERRRLETLVEGGMTIAEIATEVGLSKTTVRQWLARYGLRTRNKVGPRHSPGSQAAKAAGRRKTVMSVSTTERRSSCSRDGVTTAANAVELIESRVAAAR